MKKSSLFIFAVLASVSSQALAFTSAWNPVVAIGGGFARTTNLGASTDFPIINPSTDEFYDYSPSNQTQTKGLFEGFLGVEHPLSSRWLWQIGLAYTQPDTFLSEGDLTQGVDFLSQDEYQYQYSIKTRQLLLQTKWMYSVHQRFYPYALVGLGAARNTASDFSTTVPYTLTYTRAYEDNTTTTFAYRLGVGVDMDVAPHVRLGVAYRFSNLGGASLGQGTINQTDVNGTLSQSAIYANEVLAQITYHF